ncbi:MAG: sugar phosphate isomerase/epimerase [Phycisphaeraceae bacterium]|nr:sugar phosphate isomerase/epimerase [Phycisphaeraceae bacterium]
MSCLSVTLFPAIISGQMTIKEYARLCKDMKLDALDLGLVQLKNHTPKYIAQVKAELAEVGMQIAMVTTYPDFTHPDARRRRIEMEFLRHDIALASAVNAKFLRVTAGQAHPQTSRHDGVAWAIKNLRAAAPLADELGVTLVFENHSKPGAWDFMDFCNPPDIFLEIAEGVRDTSIGINFDTANILVAGEDRTVEVLERVIDKVLTIHVADIGTKGKMDPVQLGTGLVPFADIFTCLKKHKWDGWLCLEEWGNNGIPGIRDAVAFVRKSWREAT